MIKKYLIIAFVLWHTFSIAIFAIPRESRARFAIASHQLLLPIVQPYVFTTSQWQLWNLFAPDPQRSVTFYQFEIKHGNDWQALQTIEPGLLPYTRHATYFKLFGNLFGGGTSDPAPFATNLLELVCKDVVSAPGDMAALQLLTYVIPVADRTTPRSFWDTWKPEPTPGTRYEIPCPYDESDLPTS